MISFERSEKEIKEKKEQAFPITFTPTDSDSKTIFCFTIRILHKFQRTKGKIEFCSYICSCFVSADCQMHFTHATDFFCTTYYQLSLGSIWRLNGSEDKTYHRGGQNDSSVQDAINNQ